MGLADRDYTKTDWVQIKLNGYVVDWHPTPKPIANHIDQINKMLSRGCCDICELLSVEWNEQIWLFECQKCGKTWRPTPKPITNHIDQINKMLSRGCCDICELLSVEWNEQIRLFECQKCGKTSAI